MHTIIVRAWISAFVGLTAPCVKMCIFFCPVGSITSAYLSAITLGGEYTCVCVDCSKRDNQYSTIKDIQSGYSMAVTNNTTQDINQSQPKRVSPSPPPRAPICIPQTSHGVPPGITDLQHNESYTVDIAQQRVHDVSCRRAVITKNTNQNYKYHCGKPCC